MILKSSNAVFLFWKNMQFRMVVIAAVVCFGSCCTELADAQFYAGVLGGISTLSGDARSLLSPRSAAFSSYDPKNGSVVEAVVGRHLSDYFAIQATYIWNRNSLALTSGTFNGTQQGFEERRRSSEQSAIADLLVYFRPRGSRLRPYLSVGTGLVHFQSSQEQIEQSFGNTALPPQHFSSNLIALHVPVGIDVNLKRGWAFRYTFSETLSKNPVSDRLSPQGQHSLKNFQNLFGFIWRF